ncbi:MAG TPA: ribosome maturation factor RimM [Steroidobacteraceae bacterium]|nr:ribosome maturation factor RimM [Steroidobacteraceae bacterium]
MSPRAAGPYMTLGQVGAAHGVHGWLMVRSFADPPDSLLDHEEWQLLSPGGKTLQLQLLEGAPHRDRLRVRLSGIDDRDAASALTGWWVQIARSALPPPAEGEYFRDDLVGFDVVNTEGVRLGRLDYFADLPAGAVMVVKGEREHWVPAAPRHLLKVDLAQKRLTVDWPAELE